MNKTVFSIVCIACAVGGLSLVFATELSSRDLARILVLVIVVLPALAWLRLRNEAVRKGQSLLNRKAMQAQQEEEMPINPRRRLRRRAVAIGMLVVGVTLVICDAPMVLKSTTLRIAWIVVLVGAVLLLGELMGFNVFRNTPLDKRRDAPQRR